MSDKLFVYAPNGRANDLVKELKATKLTLWDGLDFRAKGKRIEIPQDSIIINWGRARLDLDDVKILNGGSSRVLTGSETFYRLYQLGMRIVPTIFNRRKASGMEGYVVRRKEDNGIRPLFKPESASYWTKRMNFTEEYRLHLFNGRVIKSGKKVVKPGFTKAFDDANWEWSRAFFSPSHVAHPWWRSNEGGWTIDYSDNFKSTPAMRELAHKVMYNLRLHFAAIDLGLAEDGKLYIIDADPAPKLEGILTEIYAKNIARWIEKPESLEMPEDERDPAPAAVYAPPPMPQAPRAGGIGGRRYQPGDIAAVQREMNAGLRPPQFFVGRGPDPIPPQPEPVLADAPDQGRPAGINEEARPAAAPRPWEELARRVAERAAANRLANVVNQGGLQAFDVEVPAEAAVFRFVVNEPVAGEAHEPR